MINWSIDEEKFKQINPQEYKIWRLSQLINYGLDGEKIDAVEVKKSWNRLQTKIDEPTKNYLRYLLWGKLPSLTKIKKRFSSLS